MAFSLEERSIINFGVANNKSRREVEDAIIRLRTGQGAFTGVEEEKRGVLADIPSDIQEFGSGVAVIGTAGVATGSDIPSDIQEFGSGAADAIVRGETRIATAREQVEKGEISPLRGTFRTIGSGLQTGAEVVGEAFLGGAKLFTSQEREEKIAGGVEEIATKVLESDTVQEGVRLFESLDKETQKDVLAGLGVAEGLVTMFGVGPVLRALRTGTSQGVGAVGKTIQTGAQKTKQQIGKGVVVVKQNMPENVRTFHSTLTGPKTLDKQVSHLSDLYRKSFVQDSTAINNKLDKVAQVNSSVDVKLNKNNLLDDLAKDGGVPVPENKLANFNNYLTQNESRRSVLMKEMNPLLKHVPETTDLSSLRASSQQSLRSLLEGTGTLDASLRELDRFFKSFETEFPRGQLTAEQINNMRIAMNAKSKAFRADTSRPSRPDAAYSVGNAIRKRLDEISPQSRGTNAEWARLNALAETASLFHYKPIDVGIFNDAIGRYIGAAVIGTAGVATGSGSLVIAGLAATLGGKWFADQLRKFRFRPSKFKLITESVKNDAEIVKKLIDDVKGQDKAFLERALLPAGTTQLGPKTSESGIKVVPAQKGPVGADPKTGKFIKTFKSGTDPLGKGETPVKLNALAKEARKFDTAEEFIRNTTVEPKDLGNGALEYPYIFHGTTEKGRTFLTPEASQRISFGARPAVSGSDNALLSEGFTKGELGDLARGEIRVIEGPLKIIDKSTQKGKKLADSLDNDVEKMIEAGYDGVAFGHLEDIRIEAFRKDIPLDKIKEAKEIQIFGEVQTPRELTDIWEKANNK